VHATCLIALALALSPPPPPTQLANARTPTGNVATPLCSSASFPPCCSTKSSLNTSRCNSWFIQLLYRLLFILECATTNGRTNERTNDVTTNKRQQTTDNPSRTNEPTPIIPVVRVAFVEVLRGSGANEAGIRRIVRVRNVRSLSSGVCCAARAPRAVVCCLACAWS